MSGDDFELDFVLVRGPALLDRRLHVRLPRNGTPITIGRAAHCTTLLDPSLLFSSQVQCSLFAMLAKAPATPAPPPPTEPTGATTTTPARVRSVGLPDAEGTPEAGVTNDADNTPAHQTTRGEGSSTDAPPLFRAFITDMCSSNGTFVNGLRISGTDPTELQHGDVCIFGGMRDVEEGEVLPPDAYTGPELVLWRVDMGRRRAETSHNFDFTATPLVLPAQDVLAAEARALMDTAQRSLSKMSRRSAQTGFSATPAAQQLLGSTTSASAAAGTGAARHLDRGETGEERHFEDSPRGVPQQLFTSPAPRAMEESTTVDEEGGNRSSAAERQVLLAVDGGGGDVLVGRACRRSVSLVSTTPGAEDEEDAVPQSRDDAPDVIPAEPPHALHFTAVRLGNVTFHAEGRDATSAADAESPLLKRTRVEGSAVSSNTQARPAVVAEAPPLLMCTDTHVKWTMLNPNELLRKQQQLAEGVCGVRCEEDPTENTSNARATRQKPFYGMLAVTSICTVLACVECRGLAVELRDGCQLPLVEAAVMSGPAESRWVVWTLDPEMRETAAALSNGERDACSSARASMRSTTAVVSITNKKCTRRGGRKAAAAKLTGRVTETEEVVAGDAAPLTTPEERFEAWLKHFELFYRGQGVPAPHAVDAATFSLVFAPPLSPT
jgi:hypothetical protein